MTKRIRCIPYFQIIEGEGEKAKFINITFDEAQDVFQALANWMDAPTRAENFEAMQESIGILQEESNAVMAAIADIEASHASIGAAIRQLQERFDAVTAAPSVTAPVTMPEEPPAVTKQDDGGSRKGEPYTEEEDQRIREMLVEGKRYLEIAAALGRPKDGVQGHITGRYDLYSLVQGGEHAAAETEKLIALGVPNGMDDAEKDAVMRKIMDAGGALTQAAVAVRESLPMAKARWGRLCKAGRE